MTSPGEGGASFFPDYERKVSRTNNELGDAGVRMLLVSTEHCSKMLTKVIYN